MGLPEMDVRISTLAALCAEGYSDRIVLSHDVTCYSDWEPTDFGSHLKEWVQTHVTDEVVPAMLAKGITEEQVAQMMTGNPRRIFDAQGSY
jgi:phosphotriesterase-related protein